MGGPYLYPNAAPERIRRSPLGLPKVVVQAGQQSYVDTRPFTNFRGGFLAVAKHCARFFDIIDIRIGNMSHNPGLHGMPAEFFIIDGGLAKLKETAFHQYSRWDMLTATPANIIRLVVLNKSDKPRLFEGSLFGVCAL